jgi:hypothetical protein
LTALDKSGCAKNSIVVFFCDNGPNGWRWNGGMKGRKGSTYEGGVRSPLHVRWPTEIKPGTVVPFIAGAIDVLPTLADLAGIKLPQGKRLDGISQAPALRGAGQGHGDRVLMQYWNDRLSVRSQAHRLDADGKLFDMIADPGQTRDIATTDPASFNRLKAKGEEWKRDVFNNIPKRDLRPFTVGYPVLPITVLPARDGIPHGGVTRSARAPNCSYFTNWRKPDDRISWDLLVSTGGKYRVEIYYACPQTDVGATINMRLGLAGLTKKLEVAHDPKTYGQENDRVLRVGESYMKDFKAWEFGEVLLRPGRCALELEAPQIPGKQAMEVRSVVLTLLP